MSPEESKPEFSFVDLLNGLYYPSESDERVDYLEFTIDFAPPLTVSQLKDLLLITPEIYVEEVPETEFWEPVITDQDWYEDEEKQRTARFVALKQSIEQILKNRQVFRVGEGEVDFYLLGQKADGFWAGLKTLLVDTAY